MAFLFAYAYLAANTPRIDDERDELKAKFEDGHYRGHHDDRLLGEEDALILAHNRNNNNNQPNLAKPNVDSKKQSSDEKSNEVEDEEKDNKSVLDDNKAKKGPLRPPSGPVPLLTSLDFKRAASRQSAMQKRIQTAIINSWAAYRRSAWGYDHLKPISRTGHNWFHIGLTILDSLDTLQMAGLEKGELI